MKQIMLIKKIDIVERKNSASCVVYEYEFPAGKLGFATALINGRYPDEGFSLNKVCDTIYFVLAGSGEVNLEGKILKVTQGDAILVKAGEKYFTEGNNLEVAISNSPSWYIEQYKIEKQRCNEEF